MLSFRSRGGLCWRSVFAIIAAALIWRQHFSGDRDGNLRPRQGSHLFILLGLIPAKICATSKSSSPPIRSAKFNASSSKRCLTLVSPVSRASDRQRRTAISAKCKHSSAGRVVSWSPPSKCCCNFPNYCRPDFVTRLTAKPAMPQTDAMPDGPLSPKEYNEAD